LLSREVTKNGDVLIMKGLCIMAMRGLICYFTY